MAEVFGTSYEYLCCLTDDPGSGVLIIRKDLDPELFQMTSQIMDKESALRRRLLTYYNGLQKM